jgi:uncharacterized protein (DUF1330 family)
MPAYIIFTREKTISQPEMDIYNGLAGPSLAGHPAKLLAFYGEQQILEGPAHEGAVVLEFPSIAEARAWYDGPAYQEAAKHRHTGADYRVFIVDGA